MTPLPEVTKLVKGWFMVLLPSKEEVETLLKHNWEMAGIPIILRRWTPIFDAAQIKTGKEPIWVRLSRLPFELWSLAFVRLFGNHIGEFIDADYSFKQTRDMAMARILVLIDLREGLAEDLCLDTNYGSFTQMLDYEGVPFRCHRCHSTDHLLAQCNKIFSGKWKQGSRKDALKEEVEPIKKEKGVSEAPDSYLSTLTHTQKATYMIPRSVQIQAAVGGGINRDDSNPDG